MTLRAMKAGAVEFLSKPFQKDDLLAAIDQGLARDRARREKKPRSPIFNLGSKSLPHKSAMPHLTLPC